MKIIFTADLHGNKLQYTKLFKYAEKNKPGIVIIGGDITPKDKAKRTPKKQAQFLENFLIPTIKEFYEKNKIKTALILGNDDFRANSNILEKNKFQGLINITNKKIEMNKDFTLIGYTYVPVTPFIFKDWEKKDHTLDEKTYRKDFIIEGYINKNEPTKLELTKKDTIYKDLEKYFKKTKKKTILVAHAPPYKTNIDITRTKEHVGSIGVLEAIKKFKPTISLHGHIHETVKMTGKFMQKINSTYSFSPGNNFLSEKLKIILIDTDEPDNAERIII